MTAKSLDSNTIKKNEAVMMQALGRRRRRQLDNYKITGNTSTAATEEQSEYVSLRNRTRTISTTCSSDLDENDAVVTTASVNEATSSAVVNSWFSTSLYSIYNETAQRVSTFFQFAPVADPIDPIVFTGFAVDEQGFQASSSGGRLRLPWEVRCAGDETYHQDYELKEKIQRLSFHDDNFLEPFLAARNDPSTTSIIESSRFCQGGHKYYNDPGTFTFVLDRPHTQLAYRIMRVDPQLRATRERLLDLPSGALADDEATNQHSSSWSCTSSTSSSSCSGGSLIKSGDARETAFWQNYFYHCHETRIAHLAMYEDMQPVAAAAPASSRCIVGSSCFSYPSAGCQGLPLMMMTAEEDE